MIGLWPLDDRGFIQNAGMRAYVDSSFSTVMQAAVTACVEHIGPDLHSIYATGSIPCGVANPQFADLELVAVLEYTVDPELVMQDWIPQAEDAIIAAHAGIRDARIELWPQGYIFGDPEAFSIGAFILRTRAVCIWGSDLTPELPEYNLYDERVRAAVANDDIVQLQADIEEATAAIHAADTLERVAGWCRYICEHIVLTGFALTMVQSGGYTRDVDVACEIFAVHYPQQAAAMRQALAYIRQPTGSASEILSFLATHGRWMITTCDAWLDVHNPDREPAFVLYDADEAGEL